MKIFTSIFLGLIISLSSYAQEISINLKSGVFSQNQIFDLILNNDINYRYMVFDEIPTEENKKKIQELGITFLEYVPKNMFIVSYSKNIDVNALSLLGIKAMLPILPEYKINPQLQNGGCPDHALEGENGLLKVILHENVNIKEIKNKLGLLCNVDKVDNIDDIMYVKIPLIKLNELASLNFVSFIEPIDGPGEPENKTSRTLIRSNILNSNYPTGRSYNGSGISVIMRDDGLINTGTTSLAHPDKKGRVDESKCFSCSSSSGSSHGDHVSGTIMGAGNVDPQGKGMADGVFLFTMGAGDNNNYDSIPALYNSDDAFITSASWGDGCNNGYTSLSNKLDKQVRDYPSLMHVFSCGNSQGSNCGYGAGSGWGNITGGHKQAKNVIAVGNLDEDGNLNTDAGGQGSSRGPAADGRIKPDICAVGSGSFVGAGNGIYGGTAYAGVYSTGDPSATNLYYNAWGTSMACPAVSGTLALLHEAYRDLNGNQDANSGLLKCILLNSADDIGNPGPDFSHGFGELNAFRAVKLLENNNYFSGSISQSGTNVHNITVPSGTREIKVMVYWQDKEASTSASIALVNDINMSLTSSSGWTYNPWVLDPTPNVANLTANATRGIDNLNNMEQVTLSNPQSGNHTLTVNGFSIPNGPQEYWVSYEFISDDITVTYPIGGEGIVPGETEIIRWDTYGTIGNFTLEYSLDNGASWILITNSVPGTDRQFVWGIPNIPTGEALVRVSRGSFSGTSFSTFAIIGVPSNIAVNWICPDSVTVSWGAVTGATSYNVYMLGDKYMDLMTTSTSTTASFINPDPTNTDSWFSVSAVKSTSILLFTLGGEGRRAIAVNAQPTNPACIPNPDLHISNAQYNTFCFPLPCATPPPVSVNGTIINFNVDVENQGTETAGITDLGYYLSTNDDIFTCCQDHLLGIDQVDGGTGSLFGFPFTFPLAAGTTSNETATFDLSSSTFNSIPSGTYYIGAYADYQYSLSEVNENNNAVAFSWTNGLFNPITGFSYIHYQITIQRGCMDPIACNYDSTANINNSSCIYLDAPAVDLTIVPWILDWDWDCDGSNGTSTFIYNSSGTATAPSFTTIDWSMCGTTYSHSYPPTGSPIYTGTYANGIITGTMVSSISGSTGCFTLSPQIPGCTDPLASNYNPAANTDDGSCCYDNFVTIIINTGDYGYEMDWNLTNSIGDTVASNCCVLNYFSYTDSMEVVELCLPDDCYSMNMFDTYGDGWNGGNYEVWTNGNATSATATMIASGTALNMGNIAGPAGSDEIGIGTACTVPSIVITNPMDGSVHYCLDNPTIGFVVSNFTVGLAGADGHIHYSVNGGATTMQYDTTHIQFTNLANGSYQFVVELVDNSHNSFSPVISDTVNFTINIILGCIDPLASNYDGLATCNDGSCTYLGCTDPTAPNYNSSSTIDDGSCCYTNWVTLVMTDSFGDGWNGNTWTATSATGGNTYGPFTLFNGYSDSISFCMDHDCFDIICGGGGYEYEVGWELIENGISVLTGGAPAIMQIGIGSGSCTTGCTNSLACNYDPTAGIDDGLCILPDGCTDPSACNYDPTATCDDGSCEWTSCVGCGSITGVNLTDVIHDRATFNWDDMNSATCVVDQIRIRISDDGGATYSIQKTMGAPVGNNAPCLNTSKLVLNLTASTVYMYDFKIWYQDGTVVSWHAGGSFTTADPCLNATNITVTSLNNVTKADFCWDAPATPWTFVRLKYRENVAGSLFSNIGGMGVMSPTLCKEKAGLTPGTQYRVMWRTWCANGGPYRSPTWDGPVIWDQPTASKLEGGESITNLAIFPNPSRDVFNITFISEEIQDLKVRVLNVIGEELISEDLQQFTGEYTKRIDLTENAKGIYFLEIEINDGIINKKLILQ